jgi:twitching motility protein PilT
MNLDELLGRAVSAGASDIHLKVSQPPMLRVDGTIRPMEGAPTLTTDDLNALVQVAGSSAPHRLATFRETGELDASYETAEETRFRVNAFRQRGMVSIAMRFIPRTIPSFEDLHMPPGIRRLAETRHGLVLVTGATGAGKSTTLAAMVRHINKTRSEHIVTIEDPIEVIHPDESCIVNQREIGIDTGSFGEALRRALRQDPDTILIGELRDSETATTALQAAESGHLVLSTMHTVDAAETIGRMVEFFPSDKQPMIRSIMAGVLRGVVSQRLLPRKGGGRIAAVEVMVTNERIADLIRDAQPEEIPNAIEEGSFYEMQTLSRALIDLVLAGMVERELAAGVAPNKHDFMIALTQAEKARAARAVSTSQTESSQTSPMEPRSADDEEEAPPLRLLSEAG